MLKPIDTEVDGQETALICSHWKKWPPPHSTSGKPFEVFRESGEITEHMYQQAKVWERMCGLTKMDLDTCLQCPLVRRLEKRQFELYAVTLDGLKESKITDLTGTAAQARYRRKPERLAAWLVNIQFEQEQQQGAKDGGTED